MGAWANGWGMGEVGRGPFCLGNWELGIAGLLKAESCAVCAKALFVLNTKHVGAAGVPPPEMGLLVVACVFGVVRVYPLSHSATTIKTKNNFERRRPLVNRSPSSLSRPAAAS